MLGPLLDESLQKQFWPSSVVTYKMPLAPIQLCTGQISGTEAAVHAVCTLFEQDDTEAVLLVDASNAFNLLNRQTALHNIQRLCPPLATVLINTYREPTELFVDGDVLYSQEGTTQGIL